METIKKNLEERSKKTISILKEDLNTVRAGRANPALLDKVMVDYYGSPTPLKNLSNVSVPDPRTLMITPFDPKSIPEIEKAINIANIGINPSNDGKCVLTTSLRSLRRTTKSQRTNSKRLWTMFRRQPTKQQRKSMISSQRKIRKLWKYNFLQRMNKDE